ncbi:N-acetylmuramoyl-L-alanine amidase [Hymenobacter sp. CRA2]|uniref:N-acetylmuramoyl-L-alanine amidase family protein n=1 Tax=Hymenobacter sp. CRA2 TaxID=1955620 RepID=UPI0026965520|nr:N-acetylmuramoyl-L-alanine amidase [Hymenobacter sp. CRA2]
MRILLLLFLLIPVAAFSQQYRKVVPKRGDVISTLLVRHGLNPRLYERDFVALNKPLLGPRNSLRAGKSYRLPLRKATPKATTRKAVATKATSEKVTAVKGRSGSTAVLFGKYGRPTASDQALRGAVFYLMSGHGGPDPGAVGQYGTAKLAEDEYAYDVTIRLARVLLEHGATVHMIVQDPNDGIRDEGVLKMDSDELTYPNLTIPLGHVARLRQYTNAVNRLHGRYGRKTYQRMITIHVDSRSAGLNTDVFFYHHEKSAVGLRLAKNIHQVFKHRYLRYQPNRPYVGTVSPRTSLYVVRNSYAPTVFIELGNIRNSKDQRRFVLAQNRQALANWICEGAITDYRGR